MVFVSVPLHYDIVLTGIILTECTVSFTFNTQLAASANCFISSLALNAVIFILKTVIAKAFPGSMNNSYYIVLNVFSLVMYSLK